ERGHGQGVREYGYGHFIEAVQAVYRHDEEAMKRLAVAVRMGCHADAKSFEKWMG
ncbi:MAG: hypothetical protein GYA56_12800, partial [Geobacteraceae bacterium]|nr:hypothetical protein [Geobacteraceae bacterium]